MTKYKAQLSGQMGEALIVAELGRRGIVATAFSGNVPNIDILAYKNNKSTSIQVKALKSGNPSVNAKKYLNIKFEKEKQFVTNKTKNIDKDLIFVVIRLAEHYGKEEFFICTQKVIQDLVNTEYRRFLKKHNNRRPENTETTHCSYHFKDLQPYKDNWGLITDRLI